MKKILKIELERAYRSRGMTVALSIGLILAVLPYGASYFDDKKTGYIKNICIHVGKKRYLLAKYIAVDTLLERFLRGCFFIV